MTLPLLTILGLIYGVSELSLLLLRRSKGDAVSADRGSLRLILLVGGGSVFVAIKARALLPEAAFAHIYWFYALGTALLAGGLLCRWLAIIYLGRFFTVNVAVAVDHRVIESGPYRYIRHPAYLGALMAFLGLGICFFNLISLLAIVVPMTVVFLWRIHVEEAALNTALGENYRSYAQHTKRLIPFVY
jgi:protein-S-isoprenylcysteine O-methyltransferase